MTIRYLYRIQPYYTDTICRLGSPPVYVSDLAKAGWREAGMWLSPNAAQPIVDRCGGQLGETCLRRSALLNNL